jgi:DeoR family suf operon transcriptional repressor
VQTTRKAILEVLKERGQATVDELAAQLGLTPMTMRHHLNVLQSQDMVVATKLQYNQAVGRPRHVYTLTEAGDDLFPVNYHGLANHLLDEIKELVSADQVRQIFQHIGEKLAAEAPDITGLPLAERVAQVVEFMTSRGFISRWEEVEDGYALHQFNCPYRRVARNHSEVCQMDMTLISTLLGVESKRIHGAASTGEYCTYLVKWDLTGNEK